MTRTNCDDSDAPQDFPPPLFPKSSANLGTHGSHLDCSPHEEERLLRTLVAARRRSVFAEPSRNCASSQSRAGLISASVSEESETRRREQKKKHTHIQGTSAESGTP